MASKNAVSAVVEDLPLAQSPRRLNDKPHRTLPPQDDITKALNADEYRADMRFDWAREKIYRIGGQSFEEGPRFSFSRYYLAQNVLIDLISVDTAKNRELVKKKQEVIQEYNSKHKNARIGYLPIIPFQKVTKANFEAVQAGQILSLPDERVDLRSEYQKGFVRGTS